MLAYARSLTGMASPDAALLDQLAATVSASIRTTGTFHVSKEAGLLCARR